MDTRLDRFESETPAAASGSLPPMSSSRWGRPFARALAIAAALAPVVCLPLVIFVPLVASLASTPAAAAESTWDRPKAGWRNGPVRHILTSDEDKAYKALKTDEERAAAIADFWAKLDPTPGTPENEFQDDFYKRVEDAGKQFREGDSQGWTTDRGKMLLTVGYPTERNTGAANRESWTYAGPALLALGGSAGTPIKVVFENDGTGRFRMNAAGETLLAEIEKADPVEVMAAVFGPIAPPSGGGVAAGAEGGDAPADTGVMAMEAAGEAEEEIPPDIARIRDAALASDTKKDLEAVTDVRTFKAEDGSTTLVTDICVKRDQITTQLDAVATAKVYARILELDKPDARPIEVTDPAVFTLFDDIGEGWLNYAFSVSLPPGQYELRTGAAAGPEDRLYTHVETVELPDYATDSLSMSSVTLASVAKLAIGLPPENPYAFGEMQLVPRATPLLGPGDELSFFYDVYNAKRDPATGKPSLDVSYDVEKKQGTTWKRMMRNPILFPDQKEPSLGYSIAADSVSQWPEGEWRVVIEVQDKLATTSAKGTVEFTIEK